MAYQPNYGWNANSYYGNPSPYQNGVPFPSPYQNNIPMPPMPQYNPAPSQPAVQPPQFVPIPIHGHTIKDENTEIAPNDIPMDGTVSLFPTENYSCIFAKHWNKDGKITTTKFVPVPADEDYVPTPGFEDEMRSRMDELKDLIQQNGGHSYSQQNRHCSYGKKSNNRNNNSRVNGDSDATV